MGERERERDRHPLEARAQVPDKRERERGREAHKATMSSVAKFLVEKHWKIAQVVIPASVLFGFVYTMKFGTNPLQDSFSDAAARSREITLGRPGTPRPGTRTTTASEPVAMMTMIRIHYVK